MGNKPERFYNCKSGLFYRYDGINDLRVMVDTFYTLDKVKSFFLYNDDSNKLWQDFTTCFRIIEAAGGLVWNSGGEVLVIYRRGKWDLPKGKVDAGEEIHEAALREVKEECGLSSLKIRKKIVDTYHCYLLNEERILKPTAWFEMEYSGEEDPTPQAEEDITDIKWCSPAKLDFLKEKTFPLILEVLNQDGIKI